MILKKLWRTKINKATSLEDDASHLHALNAIGSLGVPVCEDLEVLGETRGSSFALMTIESDTLDMAH